LSSILNLKSILIFLISGHSYKFFKFKKNKYEKEINDIVKNIKQKDQVLKFKINGIIFGDLIYDNYLRKYAKHTIDINDLNFRKALKESIEIVYFWFEFFSKNNVTAVNVSHSTYLYAVPMRIAQNKDIASYISSINFTEYFDKNRKGILSSDYRDYISTLEDSEKEKALNFSKKKLEQKFNSEIIDYSQMVVELGNEPSKYIPWSKLNTFGKVKYKNLLKENSKPNAIIFSHCFFDAPHVEGEFLFNDYYDWIDYIGKLSKETDYNWYVKKHPHSVEKKLNSEVIENFINNYKNITLLPIDSNNSELLKNKIDLILTVGGSVAYEYSFFQVPVIIAGNKTSYENYDIAYQPKSLEEYNYAIKNFKKIKFSFSKKEIYRYYYNIYLARYDLLNNLFQYKIKLGKDFFTDSIFKIWLKEYKEKNDNEKIEEIKKFIIDKKSS
jgi:hypothetical protein